MSQLQQLQKRIMRRVYYAYAMRISTHPITLNAALLVLSLYILTALISVSSIIHNMSEIKVGDLSHYILNAFTHAQVLTLVTIGIIFFAAISLRWNIRTLRIAQHMQTI